MSRRYYAALYPNEGWVVFDNCVDKGQGAVRIGMVQEQRHAKHICEALNEKDGEAKAAFDARELETVSIQANRGTTFSMDVESHAKRYYVGPGGLCVYGSHEAIDAVRGKLNSRYLNLVQERDINKRLRANLKDAQQSADSFKAERDKLADAWQQCHNHNTEACRAALEAAQQEARDYANQVKEQDITIGCLRDTLNYWRNAYDNARDELEKLRKRISEL